MDVVEFIENYCVLKNKNTGETKKIKLSETQKHFIDMQDKLKRLKELQSDLNTSYNSFRKKFDKAKEKYNEALLNIFNFEDKYIKIKIDDKYMYMKCSDVFKHGDLSGRANLIIRGYGFHWIITPYDDYTFSSWDAWIEHKILLEQYDEDIIKEFNNISIITKEEFNEAFEKMISDIIDYHNKNK